MGKPPFDRNDKKAAQIKGRPSTQRDIKVEVADLYKSLATGLFRYIMCLVRDFDLAQDAVQETFLRYYEYRLNGSSVPEGRGWFFKVARNYIIDRLRTARTERSVGLEEGLSRPDNRNSPYEAFVRMEALDRLSDLLTTRELECLQLRAEGFKYKEIAGILNIEPGTVGATLAHGLKKIRSLNVHY